MLRRCRPRAQLNAIPPEGVCLAAPASAAVASAIIVALETASPGVRSAATATLFASRNFRHDPAISPTKRRRRALQLHPERRGRRASGVTAIATFRIITCPLSTWITRDTCAHCARNTCDLLLPPPSDDGGEYFVRCPGS